MGDIDSKRRSFKTVCHKDLLTISNENVFFGFKMGGQEMFLGFFARHCGLHLEHIFSENTHKKKSITL